MRPKRTNSVKKYGNASRLKKKSAIRPTLPYTTVETTVYLIQAYSILKPRNREITGDRWDGVDHRNKLEI